MPSIRPQRRSAPSAPEPRFATYDEALAVLLAAHRASSVLKLAVWPKHAMHLLRKPVWADFFGAFHGMAGGCESVVHAALGAWKTFYSGFAREFCADLREFYIGENAWYLGRVGPHPVVWSAHFSGTWVWSPVDEDRLLAAAIEGPTRIDYDREEEGLVLTPDPDPPGVIDAAVQRAIDLTERTPGSRSWLFYGPPGGGKTTAARQLAEAIGVESRVILGPDALGSSAAWTAVHRVKPKALILDEVDSGPGDALLTHLERAREYADVIIQTANTLDLRGALMRPGRTDEAPMLFSGCSKATARAIAPTVPDVHLDEAVKRGLLPAYLAELEARHLAERDLGEAVEELTLRQVQIGDR